MLLSAVVMNVVPLPVPPPLAKEIKPPAVLSLLLVPPNMETEPGLVAVPTERWIEPDVSYFDAPVLTAISLELAWIVSPDEILTSPEGPRPPAEPRVASPPPVLASDEAALDAETSPPFAVADEPACMSRWPEDPVLAIPVSTEVDAEVPKLDDPVPRLRPPVS